MQVNPSWQRSGLGRAAVERLISSLAEEDISIITLYAEPKVVGLYEKLGFLKDPEGVKVWRRVCRLVTIAIKPLG